MKFTGSHHGIDMSDDRIAAQYFGDLYDYADERIQWQDLRREDLAKMKRTEKWKIVPFLRALGYWVTIYCGETSESIPFRISDMQSTTQLSVCMSNNCTRLAPLAPGDYDLAPLTMYDLKPPTGSRTVLANFHDGVRTITLQEE